MQRKKKLSVLAHSTFEIIQSKEQKFKKMKNNEESLWDQWNTIKENNIYIMRNPKEEKERDRKYI